MLYKIFHLWMLNRLSDSYSTPHRGHWRRDKLGVLEMLIDRYTTDISFWSDTRYYDTPAAGSDRKCRNSDVFISEQHSLKHSSSRRNLWLQSDVQSPLRVHFWWGPPLANELGAFWAIKWRGTWLRRRGYYSVSSNHPLILATTNKETEHSQKTCFLIMRPLFEHNSNWSRFVGFPSRKVMQREDEKWKSEKWKSVKV